MRWCGVLLLLSGCGRIGFSPLDEEVPSDVPVGPNGEPCFVQLAVGEEHACGLLGDGSVWCWGHNDQGQLANGSISDTVETPARVLEGPYTKLSAGAHHTCAIRAADRGVDCWGSGDNGQLGEGATTDSPRAVNVTGAVGDDVVVAGAYACVRSGTSVSCWGDGDAGQLGDGSMVDYRAEVRPVALSPISQIAMGEDHACMGTSSSLSCWGINGDGQLGVPPASVTDSCVDVEGDAQPCSLAPVSVPSFASDIVAVGAGTVHSCALDAAGSVWCWGGNANGQLGDGTTTPRDQPMRVANISSARALAVGHRFSCATLDDGTVQCWGDGSRGQLGEGSLMQRSSPVDVEFLTGVHHVSLSGTGASACAITDTDVWCWGENEFGIVAVIPPAAVLIPTRILPRCP